MRVVGIIKLLLLLKAPLIFAPEQEAVSRQLFSEAEELIRENCADCTARVSAMNEGALGIIQIQVMLSGDSDGDGIADDLELANDLDPNNPADALADFDQDGLNNFEELVNLGTDIRLFDTDSDGLGDGTEVSLGTVPVTKRRAGTPEVPARLNKNLAFF